MNLTEFIQSWPRLKRQVKGLKLPWLDNFAARDRDPFKVLISCILSLRTQDRTTGPASERLLRLASTPEDISRLSARTIEKAIYPVGFYRIKAKTIREISKDIIKRYESKVPDSIDELLTLKGVGRKTANLVVTVGFNKYGICVDTHVHRITNRWGLVKTKSPHETELVLREILPKRYWKGLNAILVAFGQAICQPISPFCSKCSVVAACAKQRVIRNR
jgi:endonuclease III